MDLVTRSGRAQRLQKVVDLTTDARGHRPEIAGDGLDRRRIRACGGGGFAHALDFGSWRSLTRTQGLDSEEAVELMIALVAAAGRQRPS